MDILNSVSLNDMWLYCYKNYSEFHLMVTFSLVSLFFGYAVCSVPYYIFDTYGYFAKYKIQPVSGLMCRVIEKIREHCARLHAGSFTFEQYFISITSTVWMFF